MGEYIPVAPVNDQARKHNQNLPGLGGIFNLVNFHTYHYAGNNPVKLTDPDGRTVLILGDDIETQNKIVAMINSLSKDQYELGVGGMLQKKDGINQSGSQKYSDDINFLLENGLTTINIDNKYFDPATKNYQNLSESQGGVTVVQGATATITITGKSANTLGENGKLVKSSSNLILMHEISGHARPNIEGKRGNAITIDNNIRTELNNNNCFTKIPLVGYLFKIPLRQADSRHFTHSSL